MPQIKSITVFCPKCLDMETLDLFPNDLKGRGVRHLEGKFYYNGRTIYHKPCKVSVIKFTGIEVML